MKFKVGDKVRVRKDLLVAKRYGGRLFESDMQDSPGQICRVSEINGVLYKLDNHYRYSEEMLEELEE